MQRRQFLRGFGTTMALPLLEAFAPGFAWASTTKVQRLLWIYIPFGHSATGENSGDKMPMYLQNVLAPIRDNTTIIQNLSNTVGGAHSGDAGCAHPDRWLPFTGGVFAETPAGNGQTFDQILAPLNVGTKLGTVVMNGSYRNTPFSVQANTPSFTAPDRPIGAYTSPQTLFNYMFTASTGTDARLAEQNRRKTGILHYVNSEISALKSKVTAVDRVRLDEYFTGIEDLERRIASTTPTGTCAQPTGLAYSGSDYATTIKNFYDVIYHAFLCDLTRVSTFINHPEDPNSISPRSGGIPGVNSSLSWHAISHYREADFGGNLDSATRLAEYKATQVWHYQQIVNLVTRMKGTVLPSGNTLLDESCVAWGSCMGQGDSHQYTQLCWSLAGSANGAIKTGQTLMLPSLNGASSNDYNGSGQSANKINNLWLSLIRAYGGTAGSFGDSSGVISGLLA